MMRATILFLSLGLFAAVAVRADDASLKQAIEHQLTDEGIRAVTVAVTNGVVTLTGRADSAWERNRAEEIARDHSDVSDVDNEVQIVSDRSDESIGEEVSRRLRNYVHYSIFDNVTLSVKDGIVTLMGDVTWGYKAKDMAKMASRVPGVRGVENHVEILPASANDQQLRNELASRIYGDSSFVNYSIQTVPPVHIIVENGRVTLTGVVDTRLQKLRAEQIARQTFGVFSVDNQLRIAGSNPSS